MIEGVKLVNEHERSVFGSFVPIEERIERLCAAGGHAEKGKRSFSIEVQAAFAVGIFLDGQILLHTGSVQKALELFEGGRLKNKVIIIVALGLVTDIPILIQTAEPKHFRYESHHLPQGMRILQYGVVDDVFQDAVHILKRPVQRRCQGLDSGHIAAFFVVIVLKQHVPVQTELLIKQRLFFVLTIAVVDLICAEDEHIMKLSIVVEACDVQIIVVQARRHVL